MAYIIVSKGLLKRQVSVLGVKKYAYGGALFFKKSKANKVFKSLPYYKQRNQKIMQV